MNVLGIAWAGTRTGRFEAMRTFLIDRLGLRPLLDLDDFSVFDLPNGDRVELLGETNPANEYFTTGPVVEFLVDDVDEACAELGAAGVEFLAPIGRDATGNAWANFRAPDGNIWGITDDPAHPLRTRP